MRTSGSEPGKASYGGGITRGRGSYASVHGVGEVRSANSDDAADGLSKQCNCDDVIPGRFAAQALKKDPAAY